MKSSKNTDNSSQFLITERFPLPEEIRRIELRYELNAAFTEAVKQGNLALALRLCQHLTTFSGDLIRFSDQLRNMQNLCVILNTQLRVTLENEGIHPYKLDRVSGNIAAQINKFKTTDSLELFLTDVLSRYCELVHEDHVKHYSRLIRISISYIHSHLSENISVKDTAHALFVNADYLSHQFCAEVGMPFITYVNHARTKQAAALLKHTSLSIQEISSAVGYNNTSYFAKQFYKFYHMTPKHFRRS